MLRGVVETDAAVAFRAGTVAIGTEMADELFDNLQLAGLTAAQALVISDSAKTEIIIGAGTIAVSTLHLAEDHPITYAAGPLVQGAIKALSDGGVGLGDLNLRAGFAKVIMSSTFNSLGGRVASLGKGELKAMQSNMVGSAVKSLNDGGLGGEQAANGIKAVTSGAVEALSASTSSEDAADAASGMAQSSVENLGTLGLTGDQIEQATESAAKGTVAGLSKAGISNENIAAAAQKVAAGSVAGLKGAGVADDRIGAAAGSVAAGAISGLEGAGLSSAQIVSSNSIASIVAGAVGALSTTGISASGVSGAVGDVAGKSVSAIGKALSESDRKGALADVIDSSVKNASAAGIKDFASLASTMTAVSKKSVEALSSGGFSASAMVDAAATITKTGMTSVAGLGTSTGSDLVTLTQNVAQGAANGVASLAKTGSLNASQLAQSAAAIGAKATDAFVTMTASGALKASDATNFLQSVGQSTMTGLAIGGASSATITTLKTTVDQSLTSDAALTKIGVSDSAKAAMTANVAASTSTAVDVAKQIASDTMPACLTAYPDSEADKDLAARILPDGGASLTAIIACKASAAGVCPKARGDAKGGISWQNSSGICKAIVIIGTGTGSIAGTGSNGGSGSNGGTSTTSVRPCPSGSVTYPVMTAMDRDPGDGSGQRYMCSVAAASACPAVPANLMQWMMAPTSGQNGATSYCFYQASAPKCADLASNLAGTTFEATIKVLAKNQNNEFGDYSCVAATCQAAPAASRYKLVTSVSPDGGVSRCDYTYKYDSCPSTFKPTANYPTLIHDMDVKSAFDTTLRSSAVNSAALGLTPKFVCDPGNDLPGSLTTDYSLPADIGFTSYMSGAPGSTRIVMDFGAPLCAGYSLPAAFGAANVKESLPFASKAWGWICDLPASTNQDDTPPSCPEAGAAFSKSNRFFPVLGRNRCVYSPHVDACPARAALNGSDFSTAAGTPAMPMRSDGGGRHYACTAPIYQCPTLDQALLTNGFLSQVNYYDQSYGLSQRCIYDVQDSLCSDATDYDGKIYNVFRMSRPSPEIFACDVANSAHCPVFDANIKGSYSLNDAIFGNPPMTGDGYLRCIASANVPSSASHTPSACGTAPQIDDATISSFDAAPTWYGGGAKMCVNTSVKSYTWNQNNPCPSPMNPATSAFSIVSYGATLPNVNGVSFCIYRPIAPFFTMFDDPNVGVFPLGIVKWTPAVNATSYSIDVFGSDCSGAQHIKSYTYVSGTSFAIPSMDLGPGTYHVVVYAQDSGTSRPWRIKVGGVASSTGTNADSCAEMQISNASIGTMMIP